MKNYISLLICLSLFFSCGRSNEDFNKIENEIVAHIENNEWNTLFDLIKEEDIPKGFQTGHRKRFKELSEDIITNFQDFKLKELQNQKDTILYGFILNSSSRDFRNRISELRKENKGGFVWGEYSFRNTFFGYNYELKGYKQHLISDGVECDIILSKNRGGKFVALRIKDFNYTSYGKFKGLLRSNYGGWVSPPTKYNYKEMMKSYSWEKVYSSIKYDSFNVFEFYFMMNNSDVLFDKYEHLDIIFNSNFVVENDYISPRILTYETFFKEYEQNIENMNDEIKKSSVDF